MNKSIPEEALSGLRSVLARYPRMHGYYLVNMVGLNAGWREDEEAALTHAFEALDDEEWPAPELRPTDQLWTDYEVPELVAEAHTVDALVGGGDIGHTRDTIERGASSMIWREFRAMFSANARFFTGVALGDSAYVYSAGAVLVDDAKAGCLFVIESD